MNRLFYARLAWQSLLRNRKFCLPYYLSIMGSVAMFYIVFALSESRDLPEHVRYSYLSIFMSIGVTVIGLFSVIFLFYTNSFLMKRRRKELGLYHVLGLGKGHISRILAWETLGAGVMGIAGGIGCGMLFQRLMTMIIFRMMRFSVSFGFRVSWKGAAVTAGWFGFILLANLIYNLVVLYRQNSADMLQEGSAGEREPKTRRLLAMAGTLCLGGGYWIAMSTQTAVEALGFYFVAVLLVIMGTYCLFTAGSIAVLKLLRRNKRFYYKTDHFITISGMLYRMKRNAVGLANICVLSTMVLVMISGTASLYLGTGEVVYKRAPADWVTTLYYSPSMGQEPDFEELTDRTASVAASQGLSVTDSLGVVTMKRELFFRNGALCTNAIDDDGTVRYEAELECIFLTAAEYEKLTGTALLLSEGEAAVCDPEGWLQEQMTVICDAYSPSYTDGGSWQFQIKVRLETFPSLGERFPAIGASNAQRGSLYAVLPDEAALMSVYEGLRAAAGDSGLNWTLLQNFTGTAEEKLAAFQNTRGANHAVDYAGTGSWEILSTSSRQEAELESYSLNGGFLFLGSFLGVLFLMAAVLIIYYKQVSEGYEDRARVQIMQKVGLEPDQLRHSVNGQLLLVFFLPLLAAAVHLCFNFRLMVKLLQLFNLGNATLTLWCSLTAFASFAAVYTLVYLITARAYYKIVA